MCKFASFVLTKDREFWLDHKDSHSAIIEYHKLNEWGAHGPNIVKVEISPTDKIKKWPSLKAWKFIVGQDKMPDWFDIDVVEKRTRAALLRRYKQGFKFIDARGCTGLTELKADAAKTIYATGCISLEELKADAAETIDATGCISLKELKADAAEYIEASGCNPILVIKTNKRAKI